jgi:hypothetical protein
MITRLLCTDFTPGTLAAGAVTDSGLAVVPPLVRGVDAPNTHPERELGEGLGPVLHTRP